MKKLFIFGIPRSGTTWTFKYVFSRYKITTFASEEIGFYTKFFGRFGNLKHEKNRLKLFCSYKSRFSENIIHADVKDVPICVGYFEFYENLIGQIQSTSSHFVDKTPLNIFVVDKLLDRYGPDAAGFFVVRNPLDQAASITYGSVNLGKWMRRLLPFASLKISYSFEMWKKAVSLAKNHNVRIFSFEEILNDPYPLDKYILSLGVEQNDKLKLHKNHFKVNSSFDRKPGEQGSASIIERYPTLVNMVDDNLVSMAEQLGYQIPFKEQYWPRSIARYYVRLVLHARILGLRLYYVIYS